MSDCGKLIGPGQLLRRPANALNCEPMQTGMSRCRLKTPEEWGEADPDARSWLGSGGSPFVLGFCTPNSCPLKKEV